MSGSAFAAPTQLFTLERSSNANQVIYELRDDNSIHPFWRMLAQDGHTEELTFFERTQAYGVQPLSQSAGLIRFAIKALPAYPVTVSSDPGAGHPYGTVMLQGADRILKRIYLHVTGGLFPGVSSIDLEVQNGDAGPAQYFNLVRAGGGYQETLVPCVSEWMPGGC